MRTELLDWVHDCKRMYVAKELPEDKHILTISAESAAFHNSKVGSQYEAKVSELDKEKDLTKEQVCVKYIELHDHYDQFYIQDGKKLMGVTINVK